MEQKYGLAGSKLYRLFRIANWAGILYFAFIHIGICMLPVRKAVLICNPVGIAFLGNLLNFIREGLDSGTESLGWLLLYFVCAMKLVGKDKQV